MVCIIDDREDVWEHASNLIHVKPYRFFQHTGDIHAPPGLTKCENDDNKQGFDFAQLEKDFPDDISECFIGPCTLHTEIKCRAHNFFHCRVFN